MEIFHNKLWLAPLSGISNSAFRKICKQWGADVVLSEMISADGLIRNSERTRDLALFSEEERPIGLQIFGSKPEVIAKGIKILLEYNPDFVDINIGCPANKVVKRGAGSAILRNKKLLTNIIDSARKVLKKIPLTVKIRSGWDSDNDLMNIVKLIEQAGASAIILHPRTRKQMFTGKSNWELIRKVKEIIRIPVIGNGDITTVEDAQNIYQQTNCDSIMIGRAARGNPWIFQQTKSYLKGEEIKEITPLEIRDVIKMHYLLLEKDIGNKAIRNIRKHIIWYIKGLPNNKQIKDKIVKIIDRNELLDTLNSFFVLLHRHRGHRVKVENFYALRK